jgi:hypothetical protein
LLQRFLHSILVLVNQREDYVVRADGMSPRAPRQMPSDKDHASGPNRIRLEHVRFHLRVSRRSFADTLTIYNSRVL